MFRRVSLIGSLVAILLAWVLPVAAVLAPSSAPPPAPARLRPGDKTTVLGLQATVESVDEQGNVEGVVFDETTCLGDLIQQGYLQPIQFPTLPGQSAGPTFSGTCGKQPANVARVYLDKSTYPLR